MGYKQQKPKKLVPNYTNHHILLSPDGIPDGKLMKNAEEKGILTRTYDA